MAAPFEDSRRLTGPNLYFRQAGAALESAKGVPFDEAVLARWQHNIADARSALAWPQSSLCMRRHATGVSLAFAAPMDQLYAATAVNEWAWCDALGVDIASDLKIVNDASDRAHALRLLRDIARTQARPMLARLQAEAQGHGVPLLADDDAISLGAGSGSRTWPIDALPQPADVAWTMLYAIPTALVTGSNGKTTTVRLIAAMAREHGWPTAHSCTDGVFFDGRLIEAGDFSGPGGARACLRHPQARAAVLETARGGLLRRGLAVQRADAAVVTNIAEDHFGEYGIHDLRALAHSKLIVARAIDAHGLLALNADDALLVELAAQLDCPLGWFAQQFDHPLLQTHRDHGGPTCGVRSGRLLLSGHGAVADLGDVARMPLTLHGHATYNIANLAAAALAATAMGVSAASIGAVCARFGGDPDDNEGRMHHRDIGGISVVLDYANNADGLHQLLQAGMRARGDGRLAIMLGHAGNREDADYRALARIAVDAGADLMVLRKRDDYLRGRPPGDVAGIIAAELGRLKVDPARYAVAEDEIQSVRAALRWAQAGDLLLLPVHSHGARIQAMALMQRLQDSGWRPGLPLPEITGPTDE